MLFGTFPAYISVDAQIQAGQVAGVKITSDQHGQAVPISEQLTIYGTSTDNALNNFHIYLTVNGRKLLQSAIATGPGGIDDYSQWQFSLTPDNSNLQEGVNNITANYSCIGNIDNIAKDSINVIGHGGVPASPITPGLTPELLGNILNQTEIMDGVTIDKEDNDNAIGSEGNDSSDDELEADEGGNLADDDVGEGGG
jgi:hypothetical protein